MSKIPLIVVAGPTASGKTSLSIELAKRLDSEIVSADSMQIYKYMNIGSAKPDKEEIQGIKHYMLDEVDPSVKFSVAQYAEMAHEYIKQIHDKGKVPVMVGGTGLYIQSVVDDVEFKEEETDTTIRDELTKIGEEKGGEYLVEMLREVDPVSAERLHPNNMRRVIRAIEFYRTMGFPISEHQENTKQTESRYKAVQLAINWDREILYDRINKRVDIMVEAGLFDEVKMLMDKGYTRDTTAMQGIGYKEVMDYFDGLYSKEETIELVKRNSRRYAKRQLTWFRRDKRIHWLDWGADIVDRAMEIVKKESEEYVK